MYRRPTPWQIRCHYALSFLPVQSPIGAGHQVAERGRNGSAEGGDSEAGGNAEGAATVNGWLSNCLPLRSTAIVTFSFPMCVIAMKKVARMLRTHEQLILNWFRTKGEISAGTVEGLNNKTRVVTSLDDRTDFASMRPSKSHSSTHSEGFENRNQLTDSAEEAHFHATWCTAGA
jgi:hypothetical protein